MFIFRYWAVPVAVAGSTGAMLVLTIVAPSEYSTQILLLLLFWLGKYFFYINKGGGGGINEGFLGGAGR